MEPARIPRTATPPLACLAVMAALAFVVVIISGVWVAAAGRAREWAIVPGGIVIAWMLLTLVGCSSRGAIGNRSERSRITETPPRQRRDVSLWMHEDSGEGQQ